MSALLLFALTAAATTAQPIATPPPAAPAVATADDDKMICKREGETGSLVKKRRVCYTVAEWRKRGEDNRKFAQDLQDKLRTRTAGE